MKPRELIRACSDRFRSAGIPDPENDAALILSHLTGKAPLSLRLDEDTELTSSVISAFDELACKRLERIPLQYLLGTAPFYGRMYWPYNEGRAAGRLSYAFRYLSRSA